MRRARMTASIRSSCRRHVITALQTIASRSADPLEFRSGVRLHREGGRRLQRHSADRDAARHRAHPSPEVRDLAENRIRAIVENVCAAFGAKATIDYDRGYPVTINDPDKTEFMASIARAVGGENAVDTAILPLMGAEDFSYMLEQRPGAYIFLGNGDTAGVHHPAYDFNDEASPYGVSLWAKIVETGMPAR